MSQTTPAEEKVSVDEKRAQWEQFRFVVLPNGYVNVKNESHGDEPGHIYSVETRDGSAVGCSCPHAVHRGAHCKHQIAVENAPLVITSATASTGRVATDGGRETCDRCGDNVGEYETSYSDKYDSVCGSCLITDDVDPCSG